MTSFYVGNDYISRPNDEVCSIDFRSLRKLRRNGIPTIFENINNETPKMEISSPIKCEENTNIELNFPTEKTEAANADETFDEMSENNIDHCFQVVQNDEGLKIPKENANGEMQMKYEE